MGKTFLLYMADLDVSLNIPSGSLSTGRSIEGVTLQNNLKYIL